MSSQPAPFLTATWQDVVLLSFPVDPRALQPLLPGGVEPDLWQEQHLITLVGLHFRDVRVQGMPVPCARRYSQVNLRFYVRRRCPDGWRRGVVFVKQIVPGRLVALVARRRYQEKVAAMPVAHSSVDMPGDAGHRRIAYRWRSPWGWNSLSVAVAGDPQHPGPGSLEEFVVERYYGYNRMRDGSTLEYRVDHPSWRVRQAAYPELVCDAAGLYGAQFVESLGGLPVSALVAEGLPVAVHRAVRL